jgi:MATE family multidrug resistance protein
MVLAAFCGTACCAVMLVAGPAMLTAVGATPDTLGPALAYLRIRALASPAVMVANVAQGALLAQNDSWTPLKVRLGGK